LSKCKVNVYSVRGHKSTICTLWHTIAMTTTPNITPSVATILIVDDDLPILDLLTEMLEECGHSILRAFNGQEALDLARKHRPEIIITDIMMPVMDGYELLRAIRTIPDLARTCVILASAGISRLRELGGPYKADGYIQKPFNLSEVEQYVRAMSVA